MRTIEDVAADIDIYDRRTPRWLEWIDQYCADIPLLSQAPRTLQLLWHYRLTYDTVRLQAFWGVPNQAIVSAVLSPMLCLGMLAYLGWIDVLGAIAAKATLLPFAPMSFWVLVVGLAIALVWSAITVLNAVAVLHGTYDHAKSAVRPDHHFQFEGLQFTAHRNIFSPAR